MSEAAPTILDLAFIHSFSEIKNVPPPYYVLFFLAVFIHFWTAKSAMENGATAASSTSHEQLELKFLPVNAGETPEPVPAQAPKHQLLTAPVLDQKAESSSETSDKQSTLADKPLTNCSNEE